MKKNILIVTPIYPDPNVPSRFTPIVHYSAKGWVKMGLTLMLYLFCRRFLRYTTKYPIDLLSLLSLVMDTQQITPLQNWTFTIGKEYQ